MNVNDLKVIEQDVDKILNNSKDLNDFVKLVKVLKDRLEEYKLIVKTLNGWLEKAIEMTEDLMEEQQVSSTAKVKGYGHLTQCDPYVYARVTDKIKFHKYLVDNEMKDFIVEVVPPATVRKIASDMLKLGKPVPHGVEVYFKPNIKLIKDKKNG